VQARFLMVNPLEAIIGELVLQRILYRQTEMASCNIDFIKARERGPE
jgi:hypothetical protein